MIRYLIAALALGLMTCGSAAAAEPGAQVEDESSRPTRMGEEKEKPVYVQLIVKACHRAETPLEPTGQGKIYDNEKSLTLEERKTALVALGCIDVPVADGLSRRRHVAQCVHGPWRLSRGHAVS